MTNTGQLNNVLSMVTQGPRLWRAISHDSVISSYDRRGKKLEGDTTRAFLCLSMEVIHITSTYSS